MCGMPVNACMRTPLRATLASSAVVVGEPELAAAARDAEQDLSAESVGRLADALRAWTA